MERFAERSWLMCLQDYYEEDSEIHDPGSSFTPSDSCVLSTLRHWKPRWRRSSNTIIVIVPFYMQSTTILENFKFIRQNYY
ncbi:hypothetical protein Trydic_g8125 [Trypoxylus dichotomus]